MYHNARWRVERDAILEQQGVKEAMQRAHETEGAEQKRRHLNHFVDNLPFASVKEYEKQLKKDQTLKHITAWQRAQLDEAKQLDDIPG